jgi:hypothetical protein
MIDDICDICCIKKIGRCIKCVCPIVVCVDCICGNPNAIIPECPDPKCRRMLIYEFLEKYKYNKEKLAPFLKKRADNFIKEEALKHGETKTAIQIYKLINEARYGENDPMIDQFFTTVLSKLSPKDLEHILLPMTARYFVDVCTFTNKFDLLENIPVDVFLKEYDASVNIEYSEINDIYNIYAAHMVLNIVPEENLKKIINTCKSRVGQLEPLTKTIIAEYLNEDIDTIFSHKNVLNNTIVQNQKRFYHIMLQQMCLEDLIKNYGAKTYISLTRLREIPSTEVENIIMQAATKFFNINEPEKVFGITPNVIHLKYTTKLTPIELSNLFLNDYLSYQKNKLPPHEVISNCAMCPGLVVKADGDYICDTCAKIYCNKCLKIVDKKHVCSESDAKTVKEILNNSKPCPRCGERIQKSEGCNNMFCVKCKSGFCYRTGVLIEGEFHNPHRTEWVAKIPTEYEAAEVPVVFVNEALQSYTILRYVILDLIANYGTVNQSFENKLFRNLFQYLNNECNLTEYHENIAKSAVSDLYTRAVGQILSEAESVIKRELIKARQRELLENTVKFNKEIFEMEVVVKDTSYKLSCLEKVLNYKKVAQVYVDKVASRVPKHFM